MDYPTFEAKADGGESIGRFLTMDLFPLIPLKRKKKEKKTLNKTRDCTVRAFCAILAAHGSHPRPPTWTYIVPQ